MRWLTSGDTAPSIGPPEAGPTLGTLGANAQVEPRSGIRTCHVFDRRSQRDLDSIRVRQEGPSRAAPDRDEKSRDAAHAGDG